MYQSQHSFSKEQKKILFNPQPLKKQPRKTQLPYIQKPQNIYTAPFCCFQTPAETNATDSHLSTNTQQSKNVAFFVNPKPKRQLRHAWSSSQFRNLSKDPRGKVLQLQDKVAVLRRTVSQNKIINDSKTNEMVIRVQKLKEQYEMKQKKLAQLVKAIDENFS